MDDANDIALHAGSKSDDVGSSTADIGLLFARARAAYESGDLISAHADYRAILELQPHHGDALHILGVITRELGRAVEGAELVREAIHHDPRNAAYHNTLGNFLVEEGRFETALECFRRAIELHPNHAEAHNNLANLMQQLGGHDDGCAARPGDRGLSAGDRVPPRICRGALQSRSDPSAARPLWRWLAAVRVAASDRRRPSRRP